MLRSVGVVRKKLLGLLFVGSLVAFAATPDAVAGKEASAGESKVNVELKFFIDPAEQSHARTVLELHDDDAAKRSITFYDTPSLELYGHGLIVRTREKLRKTMGDVTVKLRPMDPTRIDKAWFTKKSFKCEEDRAGTKAKVSCSKKKKRKNGQISDTAGGVQGIEALLSDKQKDLVATYATLQPDWTSLVALGPVEALVWDLEPAQLEFEIGAEQWTLPDGTVVLELSTRTEAADADAAHDALRDFIAGHGLTVDVQSIPKTGQAMKYFAGQLAGD